MTFSPVPRHARRALGLAVVAGCAATTLALPAHGAATAPAYTPLAPVERTLTADRAIARTDCVTDRLGAGSGVATTTFTATALSSLTARLDGAGDWDLAVFDHTTGRRVGGSGGWGGSEVVQGLVRSGQVLDIQACRLSGTASTARLRLESVALPPAHLDLPASPQMVEIPLTGRSQLSVVERLGIDLVDNPHAHGIEAMIHSPAELDVLRKAGFDPKVRIEDVAAFDRKERAETRAYAARVGARGSALPSGRTDYRDLEDIQRDLKTLAEQEPAIVRPVTLPKKTFQGREQFGVEISADVNRTDDQKPVSFLMGTHHAREWPAAELITEMALYLGRGFGEDPQVTDLLRRTRVVLVPVINPDGYVSSRSAQDPADQSGDFAGAPSLAESVAIGGSLAYRRKNCKGPGGPSAPCDFNQGVDPNRNYGLGWGGIGASTTPTSQSYRGPGPWSEEETQSVHEYSQKRDVTSLLTMHNYGSLVLRPPGRHTDGLAPDEARLKALGDAMEADTGYTSQYGFQLYDTSGTTEDWNYGAAGTFGYTMELGPASSQGGNFHIDYKTGVVDQWEGTAKRKGRGVRQALLRVVEAATSAQDHSALVGLTPPGRILKLKKSFKTSTSPICRISSPSDVRPNLPVSDPSACVAPGEAQLIDDGLEYRTVVPANGVFSWLVTPSTRPFEFKAGKREAWTLTCEDAAGKVYETKQVTIWRGETQAFEMPCGGTLPKLPGRAGAGGPRTLAEALSLGLVDRIPPASTFTIKKQRVSRRKVSFAGTSTDTAPQGLTPRVAKVRISIGRRVGSRCRFLQPNGRFGPKVSCLRTTYVTAKFKRPGAKVAWTLSMKAKFPKGRYLAWARGLDANGNIEKKQNRRNLVRFRIR